MNEAKVNQIARALGVTLCQAGIAMLKSAFKLHPLKWSFSQTLEYLKQNTAIRPILVDKNYYLISLANWKAIIRTDWTDRKQYVKDRYDCDNFAYSFASRMAEIYGINTAGVVYGAVYNKDTGKRINGHYWNLLLAKEGLFIYEPMNDRMLPLDTDQIIMGKWEYRANSVRFF